MDFLPKKVEKTFNQYMREGFVHLIKNISLYILPIVVMTTLSFLLSYVQRNIALALMVVIGMFFTVWMIEISFSSTQEKYTPKKYLTSFLIAVIGTKNLFTQIIFKTRAKYALIFLILFSFVLSNKVLSYNSYVERWILSNMDILSSISVLSLWVRFILTDPFVLSRATGSFEMKDMMATANMGAVLNEDMNLKIVLSMIVLTLFIKITFLANILQAGLVVALTFYSMDIYDIGRVKKQKQEQEEKEVRGNYATSLG